ncbi:MAG: nuclear transport factor 2 family protein [Pseudomonadota bacterium]
MDAAPKEVVRAFWRAMETNDFAHAATFLSEDFVLRWPQSKETIRGRADFAALNAAYPANGLWRFDLRRIVADGAEVATEVGVTDGDMAATALTFHEVRGGLIAAQVEYWPDPYDAPPWRAEWVSVEP